MASIKRLLGLDAYCRGGAQRLQILRAPNNMASKSSRTLHARGWLARAGVLVVSGATVRLVDLQADEPHVSTPQSASGPISFHGPSNRLSKTAQHRTADGYNQTIGRIGRTTVSLNTHSPRYV